MAPPKVVHLCLTAGMAGARALQLVAAAALCAVGAELLAGYGESTGDLPYTRNVAMLAVVLVAGWFALRHGSAESPGGVRRGT